MFVPSDQIQYSDPFPKQRPLNNMALDLRRTLDDPSRPRMAKNPRNGTALAQRGRASDFQSKINDAMQEFRSEKLDLRRFGSHVRLLIGLPRAQIRERPQRF